MDKWLSLLLAFCALFGGLDRVLGSRLGLGGPFERGFQLLGPTSLAMAGLLCLSPLLTALLSSTLAPLFGRAGLDASILGGILAIDMGGYPVACALTSSSAAGAFSGIAVAATLGCTLSFTLPAGFGSLAKEERPYFLRGILLGLPSLAAAFLAGGLLSGLSLAGLLHLCLPLVIPGAALAIFAVFWPALVLREIQGFAKILQALGFLGLTLGAVRFLTGYAIIPGMMPLEEAMEVCVEICISLLGSLPLVELLKRLLCHLHGRLPCLRQVRAEFLCALLVVHVSVLSTLLLLPTLCRREKQIISAALVCGASTLAHLGFVLASAPEYTAALLGAKLAGFFFALYVSSRFARDD